MALLSLLAVGVPDRAHYFCRMLDRVVDSCCCESKPQPGVERSAELKVADCCLRLKRGALPLAAALRDLVAPLSTPALPAAVPPLVLGARQTELVPAGEDSECVLPPRGPPLFLKHCALLI